MKSGRPFIFLPQPSQVLRVGLCHIVRVSFRIFLLKLLFLVFLVSHMWKVLSKHFIDECYFCFISKEKSNSNNVD